MSYSVPRNKDQNDVARVLASVERARALGYLHAENESDNTVMMIINIILSRYEKKSSLFLYC